MPRTHTPGTEAVLFRIYGAVLMPDGTSIVQGIGLRRIRCEEIWSEAGYGVDAQQELLFARIPSRESIRCAHAVLIAQVGHLLCYLAGLVALKGFV